jgi:hypothetical protein
MLLVILWVPYICPVLGYVGNRQSAIDNHQFLASASRSSVTENRQPTTDNRHQQPASSTQAMYNAATASAEAKFRHIEESSRRNPPDQAPTVLTEREINAYLASGRVQLPVGVRSVRFTGQNGVVNATARVDFDAITAQARSSNPLLSLFTGLHDVHAVAHASGSGRQGQVHIVSIDLDGTTIPRMALQFFIDRYIRPKHPEVGLDSVFALPARIDTATIGDHQLIVTQK